MTAPQQMDPMSYRTRACCACDASSNPIRKGHPANTVIVAIIPYVYMRRKGPRALKKAMPVQICESCLLSAIADPSGPEANTMNRAMLDRIQVRYISMLEADEEAHG